MASPTDVTSSSSNGVDAAAAVEPSSDDVTLMTSLLCVGGAVCVTSLAVLAAIAWRRHSNRRKQQVVVVPNAAVQGLLTMAGLGGPDNNNAKDQACTGAAHVLRHVTSSDSRLIGALIEQRAIYRPATASTCTCSVQPSTHFDSVTSRIMAVNVTTWPNPMTFSQTDEVVV